MPQAAPAPPFAFRKHESSSPSRQSASGFVRGGFARRATSSPQSSMPPVRRAPQTALRAAALLAAAGVGAAAVASMPFAAWRGTGGRALAGPRQACAFAPTLPLRCLRDPRAGAAGICMQKGGGDGDKPRKAIKKPRKRSQRAANPYSMPEPEVKPGGGPIGKAKRRMLERIEEMEDRQVAEWTGLKSKLQKERVDGVWAADNPILLEKRKRWNEDLSGQGASDDPVGEDALDVLGTNDEVPAPPPPASSVPSVRFAFASGRADAWAHRKTAEMEAGARREYGGRILLEHRDRRNDLGHAGGHRARGKALAVPRRHQDNNGPGRRSGNARGPGARSAAAAGGGMLACRAGCASRRRGRVTLTGRMRAAAGVKWLCTQTTSGHAHFGVFFEVAAKESDVYITGIRTASHYRSNIYEATYRVLVREVGLQAARVCLRAGALHALCSSYTHSTCARGP